MKAALGLSLVVGFAAGFGLARLGATPPPSAGAGYEDPRTIDSFRQGLQSRDALVRARHLGPYLAELEPARLEATLEALEQNRIGASQEELRLLMLAWTRFDAPGAFAWATSRPERWRAGSARAAAYAWGFRDGRAALAAIEALEDEDLAETLRASLVEAWIRSDDRLAATLYVATLPDPRRRQRLSFQLAAEAGRDGSEAVIAWAEAVPEDAPNDFKQVIFYQAIGVVARNEPERAIAWYERHRAAPWVGRALDNLARKGARQPDPTDFFTWLRRLPVGERQRSDKRSPIGVGFRSWYERAPQEALAWLGSELPAADLDPAVQELVRRLSQSSPSEAMDWAPRIADETLRGQSMVHAGRMWARKDLPALEAWLAANELPEAWRKSILETPGVQAGRRRTPAAAATP